MHDATPQPKRVAQYEITETLASTGKVHIYRGLDTALQRTVTLKVIFKDIHDHDAAAVIERFQNQARTSSRLNHPGIVSVYEYGEDGALAFVAEEYVEGCTLKERLRVPIRDAGSMMVQLLAALEHAHEQGVVHGNIKPSNLVLTSKGQLRITDFGGADPNAGPTCYMSPQQLKGLPLDHRSDIFSAGILVYELLTGVSPFPGPEETLLQRVCNDKERPASEVNGNVPHVFDLVCAKALAKEAEERYTSASAFADQVGIAFENAYGAPPRDLVSNQTVVSIFLSSLRGPSKRRSGSKTEPPKAEPQKPPAVPLSTWDDSVLRMVERQLAAFVGPLARMIVKEAASKTRNLDELYSLAAESLDREDYRRLFLKGRNMVNRRGMSSEPAHPPQVFELAESETVTLAGPELSRIREPVPTPDLSAAPRSSVEPDVNSDAEPAGRSRKKSEGEQIDLERPPFSEINSSEVEDLEQANRTIILKKPAASPKPPPKVHSTETRKARTGLTILVILLLTLAVAAIFLWRNPVLQRKLLSPFHRPAQTTDQPSSR